MANKHCLKVKNKFKEEFFGRVFFLFNIGDKILSYVLNNIYIYIYIGDKRCLGWSLDYIQVFF